jgi:hypothetical protein
MDVLGTEARGGFVTTGFVSIGAIVEVVTGSRGVDAAGLGLGSDDVVDADRLLVEVG